MPIKTAGSLDGICGRKGKISSSTSHLSRCSRSFPIHTKQFTRTLNKEKIKYIYKNNFDNT